MSPRERYRHSLEQGEFLPDPAQENAIRYLQRLYEALLREPEPQTSGWRKLLKRRKDQAIYPEKGLYLWGGVGRGKTWLMDVFYASLPMEQKRRVHFHRFMQQVHGELKGMRREQDPLIAIAKRLAGDIRVLCFDEFFVTDIGDAMILAGLLRGLFDNGICLVTTSNIHPDGLYKTGLQRDRFLPAIELLKTHTEIVNVDSGTDYRLQYLDRAEIYHSPLDENADEVLLDCFNHVAVDESIDKTQIEILGREIPVRKLSDGVAWFDFETICLGPRSKLDYIELAREFHTVLIADVPQFGRDDNDAARRFIELVDVFYDRNVNLILSAQTPPDQLYAGERLKQPFQRAISRLIEMQSHDYLAREHLA